MPLGDPHLRSLSIQEEEERERIVAAVVKAATEHGYAQLTVDLVLRYAGVSQATYEAHFETKEQGVIAAQEAFLAGLQLEVSGACDADEDWADNVRAALDAALGYLTETSSVARVFTVEAAAASLAAHERQFAILERFAEQLRDGRRHYPQAAKMPPTTERALVGGIASIVSDRLLSEEPGALVELEPQLAEFLLAPYLGRTEAHRLAHR